IDDLRAGLEIDVAALVGRDTDHRLEISLRVSEVVREPGFATLRGAGHPDRTGRGRAGAADAVRLFAKQDIEALERAHQGCGHPSCPGADDEYVDLDRCSVLRRTCRGDRHFLLRLSHRHAGTLAVKPTWVDCRACRTPRRRAAVIVSCRRDEA